MSRVVIEFRTDTHAFEQDFEGELERLMDTVAAKVIEQREREPGCVCTAPEDADRLRDRNGTVVGSVVYGAEHDEMMHEFLLNHAASEGDNDEYDRLTDDPR